MDSKPKIALFTSAFPYLHAEYPFVSKEFEYLQKQTDIALIVAHKSDGVIGAKVSESTKVVVDSDLKDSVISLPQYFKFTLLVLLPMILKLVFKSFGRNSFSLQAVKNQISQYLQYFKRASQIDILVRANDISVLYSYWFDHWNMIACIYKVMYNKGISVVSRAHRYEIDYNKNPIIFEGYRRFQFKYTDQVYFISSTWMNLMKVKVKKYSNKFLYRPMGVGFKTDFVPKEAGGNAPFHILSISQHIAIKRLDIIASALRHMDLPIIWHHFGEKNKQNELAESLKGSSVDYKCYGFVSTQELLHFMEVNPIHFLINTSSIEGVPVSMMEVISRGIPVIGTNVGGVSEIINEKVGYLVDENISVDDFSSKLKEWLVNYQFGNIDQRQEVIKYGIEKFDQNKNYTQFCEELNQLSS